MPARRWLIAATAVLALVAAAPIAAYAFPGLTGTDQARIVLTGSMEPAISPGDVVFVEEDVAIEDVEEGDVVTFRAHAKADTTYTHRVVDVGHNTGGPYLVTKGDANEDPDPMRVDAEMLVGRVDHRVPAYGHAIAAADTLPLELVLVGLSLATIVHEARRLRSDDNQVRFDPASAPPDDETPTFEVRQQRPPEASR